MEKQITCINCPVGCLMTVQLDEENNSFLSVTGNTCKRGADYARQECVSPKRTITAVLPVMNSSRPLSVKTSTPVPKDKIADIMHEMSSAAISLPVHIGDVVFPDILNTGSDIVATRNLPED